MRTAIAALLCLATSAAAPVEPATLRDAAAGRFLVGTAVMSAALNDPAKAALVAGQFDALTGENEFKPATLHPRPDRYAFAPADRLVDFAAGHGMRMVGHTLCWHEQTPAWFYQDAAGQPLPRAVGLAHLHDHIAAVMGHFKGRVLGWDVVNEALTDSPDPAAPDLRDSPARRCIGNDFVAQAFAAAHAADPAAELYYNDYNIEAPPKRDRALRLLRSLKAAGLRVDAVGVQGHWALARPDVPTVDAAIAAFAAAGVRVSITELDVDVVQRRGSASTTGQATTRRFDPYRDGCPPVVLAAQAARYADLFRCFVRHGRTVERVTLWGLDDGQSWLNHLHPPGPANYPLLWTARLEPKPALAAVLDALR